MSIKTSTTNRGHFHSQWGFILASAGSAVGLGNIWGFPTQTANNGGGAFLFVYLCVTLLLAVPALYAEITIGNKTQRNPVDALAYACKNNFPRLGYSAGLLGLIGAITMLSFYTIVAGWMLAHALASLCELIGWIEISQWLATSSTERNLLFTPLFILLTAAIIHQGVHKGIERWSTRLMPMLLIMLISLIIYILQQNGAKEGLAVYLLPNFDHIFKPQLMIAAMGQAFFSLSIGVGGMMVYGSYLKKNSPVGKLVLSIAALDTLIAFLAGLLIIPALYVAQNLGQTVFVDNKLVGESQLIFQILPTMFNQMGTGGLIISTLFFSLLSIAALTSTISATEVPVAFLVEVKSKNITRVKATWLVSSIVLIASMTIIAYFDLLFALAIQTLTTIIQPVMCLFYFIVIGWLWRKGNQLMHLPDIQQPNLPLGLSLTLWGNYLRFVCPLLLTIMFLFNIKVLT